MKLVINIAPSGLKKEDAVGMVADAVMQGIEKGETKHMITLVDKSNVFVERKMINGEDTYTVIREEY